MELLANEKPVGSEDTDNKTIRFSENPVLIKEQRVLGTKEASKILDLNPKLTLKLMKNGSLPSFRFGKEYRTTYLSCLKFIDDCIICGTDMKSLL